MDGAYTASAINNYNTCILPLRIQNGWKQKVEKTSLSQKQWEGSCFGYIAVLISDKIEFKARRTTREKTIS